MERLEAESQQAKGWGIQLISLENKSNYFKKIGSRATEKLANDARDLVVGLPDLYPNRDYADTEYKHNNLQELQGVQTRLVKQHLQQQMGRRTDIDSHIARFYASALKHDLEVLLLAATSQLQSRLKICRTGLAAGGDLQKSRIKKDPRRELLKTSFGDISIGPIVKTRIAMPFSETQTYER